MTKKNRNERINEYREISIQADELVLSGNTSKALELLQTYRMKAATAGDEDYKLYFEAEHNEYIQSNPSRQIELIENALSWAKDHGIEDDYFLFYALGIYYAKHSDLNTSLIFIDKSLALNPHDIRTIREKSVILANIGDYNGALNYIDKALNINPDDYQALRLKGSTISNFGRPDESIEFFKKAIHLNPNDDLSLRDWAVTSYKLNDTKTALEKITAAVRLNRQKHEETFRLLMTQFGKDPDQEWSILFGIVDEQKEEPTDRLEEIRRFVSTIRIGLGDKGKKFLKLKEAAEKKEEDFLLPSSRLDSKRSFLLVLRKWNSYTPAIPSDGDERSRGGGYFIYHNGIGTVVDPGYNFIENFYDAGCRIHDIDNIVISHAHNDHTIDFESICTLVHQYNRDSIRKKLINIYINNGAFKKFSGLLNLRDKNFGSNKTLNIGNNYKISEGMDLIVIQAYHDEVVSRDQSVGLLFNFKFLEKNRKIIFTCDTGLFPLRVDNDNLVPNIEGLELWESYPEGAKDNLDLLVVHIGSIKKEEFEVDFNKKLHECLYPNHLGIIGTSRMITKLRPKLALISEFGEEMRQFRSALVTRIEDDVVKKALKHDEITPRVAPGDLSFAYDISKSQFLCCAADAWVDVQDIQFKYGKTDKEDIYYFSQREFDKIEHGDVFGEFVKRRKLHKGMYFEEQNQED